MLKIKDNVNLETLIRYGFKQLIDSYAMDYEYYHGIKVDIKSRNIYFDIDFGTEECIKTITNKIFDLIKHDLIELTPQFKNLIKEGEAEYILND